MERIFVMTSQERKVKDLSFFKNIYKADFFFFLKGGGNFFSDLKIVNKANLKTKN